MVKSSFENPCSSVAIGPLKNDKGLNRLALKDPNRFDKNDSQENAADLLSFVLFLHARSKSPKSAAKL